MICLSPSKDMYKKVRLLVWIDNRMDTMKTLHAKKSLIMGALLGLLPGIMLIPLGACCILEGEIIEGVLGITIPIVCMLIGASDGIVIYCTHYLKYGYGKVAIKRISKNLADRRKSGKWKIEEDEILLEEIDTYGLSFQELGHYVECHRSIRNRAGMMECFFRMKDGKMLGFEMNYYTDEQIKDFINYIYDETGIEFKGMDVNKLWRMKLLKILGILIGIWMLIIISYIICDKVI